jgi:hypothetical protein
MTSCNCSQGANPGSISGGGKSKKKASVSSNEYTLFKKEVVAGVERTVYKKGNTHYIRVKKGTRFAYVKKADFIAKSKK